MFRCSWLALVLLFATIVDAQSNPENDQLRTEAKDAFDKGDFAKTKEIIARVLEKNPQDHEALHLRSSVRIEEGAQKRNVEEIRDGIEDTRMALRIRGNFEPKYYVPYLFGIISLATIEQKNEHASIALEVAKTVLRLPNLTPEERANILDQRASAHLYLKDLSSAIQDYQDAIAVRPNHIGSYLNLAQCYISSLDFDKAGDTFTAAVDHNPENRLAYNNRGMFLLEQNKPEEAITDFDKAITIDPEFATAYANRGIAIQNIGKYHDAEADFSKALSLNIDNPLYYTLRGGCRLSQGNAADAIEDYAQVIRISPENPHAQADLGFAKFFARDFEAAYAAFDKSSQIDKKSMRYLNPWKIWTLVLAEKPDAIEEIASGSVKEKEDRDWVDAQVLFLCGKISEQEFYESVSKAPNIPVMNAQICEAWYFIGERRHHQGELDAAIEFYQAALKKKQFHLSAYRGAQFALQQFEK